MSNPDRLRALLAEPSFVVMPAVWDGLTAKLTAAAGFRTAFLSAGRTSISCRSAKCSIRSRWCMAPHPTCWCWPMATTDTATP